MATRQRDVREVHTVRAAGCASRGIVVVSVERTDVQMTAGVVSSPSQRSTERQRFVYLTPDEI